MDALECTATKVLQGCNTQNRDVSPFIFPPLHPSIHSPNWAKRISVWRKNSHSLAVDTVRLLCTLFCELVYVCVCVCAYFYRALSTLPAARPNDAANVMRRKCNESCTAHSLTRYPHATSSWKIELMNRYDSWNDGLRIHNFSAPRGNDENNADDASDSTVPRTRNCRRPRWWSATPLRSGC